MTAELRSEWVCGECGMRCYKATGEPFSAPTGWDRAADRCLACAKRNEDPEDAEDRARRMVLEGKKTNEIARSCKGTTKKRVNEMRHQAIEAGELDPSTVQKPAKPKKEKPPPKPRTPDSKRIAAEKLIRDDPEVCDKEIAAAVGMSKGAVGGWRRAMGVPNSRQARRDRLAALLRAEPGLSTAEVKHRLPHPPSSPVIGAVRHELGVPAPARSTVGSD